MNPTNQHDAEQTMGQEMKDRTRFTHINGEEVNHDLIDGIYRMADIDRFSGFPMQKKNALVTHCYNTGNLFVEIARADKFSPTIEEVMFVFRHDLLETITGDLLWPAKNYTTEIAFWWEKIEESLVRSEKFAWLEPYTDAYAKRNMSERAYNLFLDCDKLDICLTLQREFKKGNTYFMGIHRELGEISCRIDFWLKTLRENSDSQGVHRVVEQIESDIYDAN